VKQSWVTGEWRLTTRPHTHPSFSMHATSHVEPYLSPAAKSDMAAQRFQITGQGTQQMNTHARIQRT